MKIETKSITIERPVFIADDGREFVDREDCEAHEMELLEKDIRFYDADFNESSVDSCLYVNLVTWEAVGNCQKIFDYYGISTKGIGEPGLYMYTDTYPVRDYWVNLDVIISKIRGGTNDQT